MIQTGEDHRHPLALPPLDSPPSIERFASEAQSHLAQVPGAPVPRCPLHHHALTPRATDGQLVWECPQGEWRCALGDYEELTWPQLDAFDNLAPILARRLGRRALTSRSLSVSRTEHGFQARFGLPELSAELMDTIREVAAPLPATFHLDTSDPVRLTAASSE